MKYVSNDMLIVCPTCGTPEHEQLIAVEDQLTCPDCWPEIARDNELCEACGIEVSSRSRKCGDCMRAEMEDAKYDEWRDRD